MPLRPYQEELENSVRQAYREGYKSPCIVLPCGGGKSVIIADIAKQTTAKGNRVLFLVHRKELCDQIRDTFAKWGVDMRLCDIMMVQTAVRRLSRLPVPRLIITDENHHCLASTYRKIYDYFPDCCKVGVTATPIRLNGDGLGDVNDKLIVGVSAKWLIENKCLAPYDYYAPSVADLTGLKVSKGDYSSADIEKRLMKSTVFGDVIKHYQKLAGGRQAVCYCASVALSEMTAKEFCKAGIEAVHIDGETPKPERDRIIEEYRRGSIDILCNVDLISEGFDVPDCGCAILLRPTKSLTLYIQQAMRCMRYQPGKRAIIIDHVGNYARHGMPDEDRTWSLGKKQQGEKTKAEAVNLKECPRCFAVFTPPANPPVICPYCEYEFPEEKRTLQIVPETELKKIEGFKLDLSTADECKDYSELLAFAKKRGYKSGWAYYQARERGFI